MDDTAAVLTPETSEVAEAVEENELTDQVEETEGEEASETETFTEEELEQRIEAARKETEERIRSEERERAETAALEQSRAQNHAYIGDRAMEKLREQAKRAATAAIEKGLDPDTVAEGLQKVHLNELITEVQKFAFGTVHSSLEGNFFQYIQKQWGDYKIPPEQAQRYHREVQSQVTERAYTALYELMKEAILATEVPKRLDEERKAAEAKNKKGEAVKNLQNPPKAPSPAKVTGEGGRPAINNMNAADAAYNRGDLTHEEYKQFRAKYGATS